MNKKQVTDVSDFNFQNPSTAGFAAFTSSNLAIASAGKGPDLGENYHIYIISGFIQYKSNNTTFI